VLLPVEAASLVGVKVATGDRAVVLVSSDTSEGILMRSDAVTRFRTAGARVIGLYLLETNERS